MLRSTLVAFASLFSSSIYAMDPPTKGSVQAMISNIALGPGGGIVIVGKKSYTKNPIPGDNSPAFRCKGGGVCFTIITNPGKTLGLLPGTGEVIKNLEEDDLLIRFTKTDTEDAKSYVAKLVRVFAEDGKGKEELLSSSNLTNDTPDFKFGEDGIFVVDDIKCILE